MTEDDVFREFLTSFDSPNDPDGEVRQIHLSLSKTGVITNHLR